jgi:hypothetical protein
VVNAKLENTIQLIETLQLNVPIAKLELIVLALARAYSLRAPHVHQKNTQVHLGFHIFPNVFHVKLANMEV